MSLLKKILLFIALFFSWNACLRADESSNIVSLLPDTTEIAPFTPSDSLTIFEKNQLAEYLSTDANIYQEYGFSKAINQHYSHDLTSFDVAIFEMEDSDAAFGIYSLFRDNTSSPLGIGDDGVEYDYEVAFWQDKYYVVITGNDGSEETKRIIKKAAGAISGKLINSQQPEILGELPQKYLLPRSIGTIDGVLALNRQLYLDKENVLNIDGESVQATFGSYNFGSSTAQLILIKTDDIENAQKIVSEIFRSKYKIQQNKEFQLFKDQRDRFYAVNSGKNLIIIYKATSPTIVKELLD